MPINLTKGGRINLAKDAPQLKRVRVGLGWSANAFSTGSQFDLDASVFLCKLDQTGDAKLLSDNHFVFYGNTTEPEGAVVHSGDNRTGDGAGDDETVVIDLAKLNPSIAEISFIVTIHEAIARKQNFGQVSKSYIVLYDDETGTEIGRYSLTEDDVAVATAVQFGSLVKNATGWTFKAVGAGYDKGLADFVQIYGGNLA